MTSSRTSPCSYGSIGLLVFFLCFVSITGRAQFDAQAQFDTLTFEAGPLEVMLTNLPPSSGCGFSDAFVTLNDPSGPGSYRPLENDDLDFPDPDAINIRLANIYELYNIKVHIRHLSDANASYTNFPYTINEDSISFSRNNPDGLQVFDGTIRMRPQFLTLALGPNDNYSLRFQATVDTRYYDPSVFTQVDRQVGISFPLMVQGISPNVEPRGVTVMPQVPYMVLHDPPGDESFSEVSSAYSTCQEYGQSFQIDNQNSVRASVKLGGGVPGFFEAYGSLEAGFTFGVNNLTNTTNEVCVTTNKAFSTSAGDEIIGDDADIFIGSGPTLAYGVANTLFYDPDICAPVVRKTLTFSPTGVNREFILTTAGIRNDIETLGQLIANNPSEIIRTRARAQIEVWEQVLAKNAQNKSNSAFVDERSIDGGATVSESIEVSTSTTQSIETKILIGADVAAEVSAGGLGVEVSGRVEVSVNTEFGNTSTINNTQSQSVGFTLADSEADNRLNVRVGKDPMYGTPVFSLQSGSRSSCPYEPGLGVYQLDQPKLSANINGGETKAVVLNEVPNNTNASFRLNICNDSDVPREYFLKLASSSNVNGAIVSVAGTALNNTDNGVSFVVPAGGCFENGGIRPLINISQSDSSLLNYPNLQLFLYPICEGNTLGELSIVDVIDVSVNYVPNENNETCSNDNSAPFFTSSLLDQTVSVNAGFCSQLVFFDPPTASDNCSVTVTQIAGPASGENFFPGTTTVTFEAKDASGNTSSTSFNVTVVDDEAPTFLSSPQDIVTTVNPGFCGQAVSFDFPEIFDNCSASLSQVAGPQSGETFFVGTTTVTFEAKDAAGNVALSSFTVTVIDNEAPTFTTEIPDITMNVNPGFCSELVFFDPPEVFDNCFAVVNQVAGPKSGENFFPGTTVVSFEAVDNSGNTSTLSFNVTIIDNEAPIISDCPGNIEVVTAVDACSASVDWAPPTAWDNCLVTGEEISIAPGSLFDVGRDTVEYRFADAAGNVSMCSFEVVVIAGDPDFCANTVGIENLYAWDNPVNLYPNPARKEVNLAFEGPIRTKTDLEIFDLQGKLVFEIGNALKPGDQSLKLILAHLEAGIYYVRIADDHAQTIQKLVLIE